MGATKDAKRLKIEDAPTITKIPVLPISYADAQPLLAALTGRVALTDGAAASASPITSARPSESSPQVKSNWDIKPLYDVIEKFRAQHFPMSG